MSRLLVECPENVNPILSTMLLVRLSTQEGTPATEVYWVILESEKKKHRLLECDPTNPSIICVFYASSPREEIYEPCTMPFLKVKFLRLGPLSRIMIQKALSIIPMLWMLWLTLFPSKTISLIPDNLQWVYISHSHMQVWKDVFLFFLTESNVACKYLFPPGRQKLNPVISVIHFLLDKNCMFLCLLNQSRNSLPFFLEVT